MGHRSGKRAQQPRGDQGGGQFAPTANRQLLEYQLLGSG